jgi:hypothetical protein
LGIDRAGVDGGLQCPVVAVVLVGVGLGELDERTVEAVAVAEVSGYRDPVAAAGVCAGQSPAAQRAVPSPPLVTLFQRTHSRAPPCEVPS